MIRNINGFTENIETANVIFQQYQKKLRQAIASQVNDKTTIDDILHDFYLSLVNKPIPANLNNIKGYLYRAVRNDMFDAADKNKRYYKRNKKYAEIHLRYHEIKKPDEIAAIADETDRLFKIVEEILLPHEIKAIKQRYQKEMDTAEAAEEMLVSKRTFSHYICSALKKIRKFINENPDGFDEMSRKNRWR